MFRHELTFLSGGECDGGGVKPIGDRSGLYILRSLCITVEMSKDGSPKTMLKYSNPKCNIL